MALKIATIVLDVADLKRSASFWRDALGYVIDSDSATWVGMNDPQGKGASIGLQLRDDKKAGINHLHIDLAAADVEKEVMRLEKIGATRAKWPYYPEKATWVVMQDPDGNEFCIVPDA